MTASRWRRFAGVAVLVSILTAACADNNEGRSPNAGDQGDEVSTEPTADDRAGGDDLPVNPCSPDAPAEETGLEGNPPKRGATIVAVSGHEYRFGGLDDSYPAGEYGFTLEGAGNEFHELALIRIADPERRSVAELLELPEDESEAVTEYVGGVTACPGSTSEALGASLEPGRYALVCFVPVGTTPELEGAELAEAYENAPHFTEGMAHEFEVTSA